MIFILNKCRLNAGNNASRPAEKPARKSLLSPRILLPLVCSIALVTLYAQFCAASTLASALSLSIHFSQMNEIERQGARLASSSIEERRDAVLKLGALKRSDASRVAVTALSDTAAIVRATAASAVLSLSPEEAATALVPLLHDRDEFVRQQSAYALGITRVQGNVPALVSVLGQDKSQEVRGAAAVALGEIGDDAATIPLAEALSKRVRAGGFVNRVRRRTTSENDFVRRAAARSLGQIKSRAAVPALIAALTDKDTSDDVRREAARALGSINDPAAIASLQSALAAPDPFLSRIAFEALQSLAPTAAKQPLINSSGKKAPSKTQR